MEEENIDNITEEKDIYDEEGIQEARDDGQISDVEAGFMQGAADAGEGAKCRYCGKILTEADTVMEREKDGERYIFCCDDCAEKYFEKEEKKSKEVFKDYPQ